MKKSLAVAAMGVALAGSAFAQTGFYLGAEAGLAFFDDTTEAEANYYVYEQGAATAEAEQDQAALAFRPFAGYRVTDNLALEFGVTLFSRETTVSGYRGGYSGTYEDTFTQSWRIVDYAVLWHPSGAAGFFARVGGHSTNYEIEVKGNGIGNGSVSESESGFQLGLGYDWKLGPGALRVSLTYYDNVPGFEDESLALLKLGYLFQF